ncbi:MAG: 3-phosphoserine/phosphohydroxythreonine transaminase [Epsilonproteobacteria bacterium]|nr:3-phosphoserine/phosphohydroxythreonine transaminase [Campylobacterota bacterium]
MKRIFNFNAGPSTLPTEVLKEAQEELLDYKGSGISIMEASHRSKLYDDVHNEAISLIKELYKIPQNYHVLFLQGGASLQFAMAPMNLYLGGVAEYADTGSWSSKAIKEAQIQNINYKVVVSSKESGYDRIPDVEFSNEADYAYITSNNTIYGTQYKEYPKTKAPLVVDASSDIFSYPIDWDRVALMFAGAQKNAGPSGVTIVIIRDDLLDRVKDSVPTLLRYKTHAEKNSLYNTPPTFGIYLINLMMKWLKSKGGVEEINKINQKKASLIYDAIDGSDGFYIGHAQKDSRSLMNVTFNIKDRDLEEKFIKEAESADMIGLKGHRSVGGIRASIYNAMSVEGVERLVELMEDFRKRYG